MVDLQRSEISAVPWSWEIFLLVRENDRLTYSIAKFTIPDRFFGFFFFQPSCSGYCVLLSMKVDAIHLFVAETNGLSST